MNDRVTHGLSPRLECSGIIIAYFSLKLLDLSVIPALPGYFFLFLLFL
uniref:Uncharacterized protein n=1 Tax=Pan troglodytes TaxID=9598 RepID=G2HEL2_PANTR|nr:hypothetical protein [Pan troglodytes]